MAPIALATSTSWKFRLTEQDQEPYFDELFDSLQSQENDIPEERMEKFLHKHYEMCQNGDHNHENNNIQWDYISSLFFTGTILTTIGNFFVVSVQTQWFIFKGALHTAISTSVLLE